MFYKVPDGFSMIMMIIANTNRCTRYAWFIYLTTLYYYIDRLLYIVTNDSRLEKRRYMTIRNTKLMYEMFNLTIYYINSFDMIL